MADASDQDENQALLRRCHQDRISELRLLNSMYNVPDELQFATTDGNSHSDMVNQLLNSDLDNISEMDAEGIVDEFSLKLKDLADDAQIELAFHLSPRYPHASPLSVYVRCSILDSQQSCFLNAALRQHIGDSLPLGEPQVMDAIAWIRDHFDEFRSASKSGSSTGAAISSRRKSTPRFQRLWLYSHHIYSKFKRKNIVALAGQLDLTGFSMPGKPGVICIEGSEENCQEFWDTLRTWTWKKIVVRHQELVDLVDVSGDTSGLNEKVKALRKFDQLKEVGFDVRHGGGREFHMNMAEFNKYLIEHDCGHVFSILFGVEGASGGE